VAVTQAVLPQRPESADEAESAMGPEHRELYAQPSPGCAKMIPRIQKQAGPVDTVAKAIEDALTADKPRARYVVGRDAKAQLALQAALPTRAVDAVVRKATGIPKSSV
jgi:hypothetical protein